jgi:hemerythrin
VTRGEFFSIALRLASEKETMTTSKVFAWKDTYNVGNTTIDRQHKKLVGLVADMYDAMAEGKGRDVLGRILRELIQYTVQHFKDEEVIMSRAQYPKLVKHIGLHCELTQSVQRLQSELESGRTAMSVETLNFLMKWLNDHILVHDHQFAAFVASKPQR